jgi:hypothetical protein
MRTSSILKLRSDKKTVPVKWRDSSWCPRIVIRSADLRGPARDFREDAALIPGADSCSQDVRAMKIRRLGRAGRRSPNPGRCHVSDTKASFPYGRSRFFPSSRLDNPL